MEEQKQQQHTLYTIISMDKNFIEHYMSIISQISAIPIDPSSNESIKDSHAHIKGLFNHHINNLLSIIKMNFNTKLNDIGILEVLYIIFINIIKPKIIGKSASFNANTLLLERIESLRHVPNPKVNTVNDNATLPNIPGDIHGLDNAIKMLKSYESNENGVKLLSNMTKLTSEQLLKNLLDAINKVKFKNEVGLSKDTRSILLRGEQTPINKLYEEALALIQYADLCHDLTRNHKLARVYTIPPPTASTFYRHWLQRIMTEIITPTSVNQDKILILQHLIINEFISALHAVDCYLYMPASQNDATIQSFVRDKDHYRESNVTTELFTLLRSLGINGMYTESTMSDLASALWEHSITESQKMDNFCLRAGRFDAGCGCGSLLEGTVNSGIGTQALCTSSCNYSESSICHAVTKFSAFEKKSSAGLGKKIIRYNQHSNDPGISPDVTMFFKYDLHIENDDTLYVTCKDNPNLVLEVRLTGNDGISLANILSVLQLASTRGSTLGQIKSDVKMYITLYDKTSTNRYPIYPHNLQDADKIRSTLHDLDLPPCTHSLPFMLEKFIGETIPLLKTWTDFIQLITLLSYKNSSIDQPSSQRKNILLIISDRSADSIQRLIGGGYTLHESKSDIILKCYDNRLRSVTIETLKNKVKIFSILALPKCFDLLRRATDIEKRKLKEKIAQIPTHKSQWRLRDTTGFIKKISMDNILEYTNDLFMLKQFDKMDVNINEEEKRIKDIQAILESNVSEAKLSEFATKILLLQDTMESYIECITSRNKHKSQWELSTDNIQKYMELLEKIIPRLYPTRPLQKTTLLEKKMKRSIVHGHEQYDKNATAAECQALLLDHDTSVLERLLKKETITIRNIQDYTIQILINKIMNEFTNLGFDNETIYRFISLLVYSIKTSIRDPRLLKPSSYMRIILVDKVLQTELDDNLIFNPLLTNCLETLDILIKADDTSTIKTYMDTPITRTSTILNSSGRIRIRMNPILSQRLSQPQTDEDKKEMENILRQIDEEKKLMQLTLKKLQEESNVEKAQDVKYAGPHTNVNNMSNPTHNTKSKKIEEMANKVHANLENSHAQSAQAYLQAHAQSAQAYSHAHAQAHANEEAAYAVNEEAAYASAQKFAEANPNANFTEAAARAYAKAQANAKAQARKAQAKQSSKRLYDNNANKQGGSRKKHNRRKKIDTRKRQRKHKHKSRKHSHAAIRTSKARPASRRFR